MSERDFIFWLKGFLVAKDGLDNNDIRFIELKIDDVFRDKEDRAEFDLSEIIKKVST
jgi:hypothetical protein